jgi:hypothetical protein
LHAKPAIVRTSAHVFAGITRPPMRALSYCQTAQGANLQNGQRSAPRC